MQTGTEEFLFKLLILRCLSDASGKMWLREPQHLYVVEILEGPEARTAQCSKKVRVPE